MDGSEEGQHEHPRETVTDYVQANTQPGSGEVTYWQTIRPSNHGGASDRPNLHFEAEPVSADGGAQGQRRAPQQLGSNPGWRELHQRQ